MKREYEELTDWELAVLQEAIEKFREIQLWNKDDLAALAQKLSECDKIKISRR